MLPLGGYVKIYGENPDDITDDGDKNRSFTAKPRIVQAAVIIAGVVFNLLLAWLLISLTLMIGIPSSIDVEGGGTVVNPRLMITGVAPESPAGFAGLKAGDVIVSLTDQGERVDANSPESVSAFVSPREARTLNLVYLHNGKTETTVITPVSGIVPGAAAIGVYMEMVGTLRLPPHLAIFEGAKKTYEYTVLTAKGLWDFLSSAVVGKSDFSQVTGPVGIVNAVGEAADIGFVNLLLFTALISINLAVINVIPFPALDGGRLLFIIIETVMRRPINTRVANVWNLAGFSLLMLLMFLVTYHDIAKLLR